jgi:hypothetical protein
MGRLIAATAMVAVVGLSTAQARAWYFPEHTEFTRLALEDYAPDYVSKTLNHVMAELRTAPDGKSLYEAMCPEAKQRDRKLKKRVAYAPPYTALCASVATELSSAGQGEGCVPYGALAALAGDHADTACELLSSLVKQVPHTVQPRVPHRFNATRTKAPRSLAVILTEASAATWADFQATAPFPMVRVWTQDIDRLERPPAVATPEDPIDYVRQLDAVLYVLDPKYTSRARGAKTHFHDATARLDALLVRASNGDVDNALGQLAAHHLRSLQLAVLARDTKGAERAALLGEALMEHAFALHFVEDGLAGGHVATDPAIVVDEKRAQRHDHFNREGLAVTRALSRHPCDAALEPSQHVSMGLHPCWLAHGDGFASFEDRRYVTEAAARIQTSFALAVKAPDADWAKHQLDNSACKPWTEHGDPPGGPCELAWTAFLLDPWPEWSVDTEPPNDVVTWAEKVVSDHEQALQALAKLRSFAMVDAADPAPQPGVFPRAFAEVELADPSDGRVAIGQYSPPAALLRPVLAAWPAARTDVTTLAGAAAFHRGLQLQLVTGAAMSSSKPFQRDATAALWGGVAGGVGFATSGIFPTRLNRTLFEANAGFAQGVLAAGAGERFRTIGVVEVRVPASTLLLFGMALMLKQRWPLDLVGDRFSWGLLGARAYWLLHSPRPHFVGWDAEVANLYLGTPGARHAVRSGITASELRLRLGVRSPDYEMLRPVYDGAFFLAVELNSGFYTTVGD